ncbi:reverse transcriptase domain-containing protein [Tanacetum coccineum]
MQNTQIVDLVSQTQKVLHERPQGALPSNTEPNPRKQVNSIMTRSGLTTAEPSIPPHVHPTPRVELEKEPETLMDEVPEKLEDPGKFLIPCILQDLEVYNSLANSGASINLMPLSIFKKLGIGPLKPLRIASAEISEIATLLSFPFGNEDKVFNPSILILGGTQIFNDESKDKD